MTTQMPEHHRIAEASAELPPVNDRWESALESQIDPFAILKLVHNGHGEPIDLKYVEANPAAIAYHGKPVQELVGHTMLELFPDSALNGPFRQYVNTALTGTPTVLDDYPYYNEAQGEMRWYDLRAVKCGRGVAFTWRDCTDRHAIANELARAVAQFRMLAENAMDLVISMDLAGTVRWASPSARAVLGYEPRDLIGRRGTSLIHIDDVEAIRVASKELELHPSSTSTVRFLTLDGQERWMVASQRLMRDTDGNADGIVIAARDVDEQIHAKKALEFELEFDSLTGLAKRHMALSRINEILAGLDQRHWALLIFGVSGLSAINHAHGYEAGDCVLSEVAERLVRAASGRDRVARVSGDEFAILLPSLDSADDAAAAAERILSMAQRGVEWEGHSLHVTGFVGIALWDASGEHEGAEDLLRGATAAMRKAAAKGGESYTFLNTNAGEEARAALAMRGEIRQGLSAAEFRAWFMPLVNLRTGAVIGYEALVRWLRSDGSIITPDKFLPSAEETGLVVEIDSAVLSQSLVTAARTEGVHFSVNVSAASLAFPGLFEQVRSELQLHRVHPSRLHLEVTETALVHLTDQVRATMTAIADLGVKWWVDDFGTGYSSISHLRDLPVAGLKLDKSFTDGLSADENQANRLAQGLVGLANGLGLQTLAEGIETRVQADILIGQGWRFGQGWLYGKAASLHNH